MDVKIFVADVVSELVDVVKLVAVDVLVALETSVDVVQVIVCEMEVLSNVVLETVDDVEVDVTVKVVEVEVVSVPGVDVVVRVDEAVKVAVYCNDVYRRHGGHRRNRNGSGRCGERGTRRGCCS